jgi:hypothetical protein
VLEDLPDLAFRPELLAAGITDDELRRLRTQRRLTALRPGAYVASDDPRLDDAIARHVLMVRAAVQSVAPGTVVSHASAAALHGLTLWGVPLDRVHLTRDRRSGGRCTALRHVHTAGLADDEVTDVDGIAVTSIDRTLATWPARCRSNRRWSWPTRRSTGTGPRPPRSPPRWREPPVPHCGRVSPRRIQRSKVKYGRALRPGQTPGDLVFAEKRREDALRDLGFQVVRWTWDELWPFDEVIDRIRRAFARA